ncbi:MAG TPA: ADP-ribosylglycohydrolase family protein [Pilimelia sp.]|nr:ADP-ribosylglycohydrolase family protein [Pilimelia sp.]
MAAGAVAAARGSLLGQVLGDAIGATAGLVPQAGALNATSGGQLACFTVDGLIRADVRGALREPGHVPSFVRHAYGRWAALQGIIPSDGKTKKWPDGWLADVPMLRESRGTAPATLAALRERAAGGGVDGPAPRSSLGPRAVTRTLPVGLYARGDEAAQLAAEIAALTHRDEAIIAAAVGAVALQLLSEGAAAGPAVQQATEIATRLGRGPVPPAVGDALVAGEVAPREAAQLVRFAGDGSAAAVLAGGVYAVASFPERDTIRDALLFASAAGEGGHVTTVAGAMLGAAHGPDALPVDWVSRLELAWVADTLARDLVRQLTESPAGSEYAEASDPNWWDRYPGW